MAGSWLIGSEASLWYIYIYIYIPTVAAALALSLERFGDNAGPMMRILTFFDSDQVPEDLLRDSAAYVPHLSEPVVREETSKDLRSFSLIT